MRRPRGVKIPRIDTNRQPPVARAVTASPDMLHAEAGTTGRRRRGDGVSTERDRLRAAYEATDYSVHEGPHGGFVIRVGARADAADALLAAAGADSWAFITACNPGSMPLAVADNAARMDRLTQRVRARGLAYFSGAGVAADGAWPPEPSLLVLGLSEAEALALARELGQLAIVVGRRGEPARLVWVEADAAPP